MRSFSYESGNDFRTTQQDLTFDDLKKFRSLDLLSSSKIGLNKEQLSSGESEDELDVKLNEYLRLTDENLNILIEERNAWIKFVNFTNILRATFSCKSYV